MIRGLTTVKKLILLLLATVLGISIVLLMMRAQKAKDETPLPLSPKISVKIATAKSREVLQSSSFLAKLDSKISASIASKLSGQIKQLLVSESTPVKRGELLVVIDDSDIQSNIDGLKATLNSAKAQRAYTLKQLNRNKKLFKQKIISVDALDNTTVLNDTADAQVKEIKQKILGLENQLEYSSITAPFDGIIGSVFLRRGDLAVPGKPILSLNSLPQKMTFSFVPNVAEIKPGQTVLFNGKKLGEISLLYNDAQVGLWVAEVELNQRLNQPVGSNLTIQVVTHSGKGCSVKLQSLLHRENNQSVMVYENTHFNELAVKVLARDKQYALISPCPEYPVAEGSESKLSLLPTVGSNVLSREEHEQKLD